jgi:hypothetical protein
MFVCFCAIVRADPPQMQRYETKYYILVTDVPRDQAREAAARMNKMAEEYHNRTRDFSGTIRTKFPFFLYRHREDYLAAGGMEGTGGEFNGHALYAVAGEKFDDRTWHVVQHEGFHQFAAAMIGGDLPVWVNEGIAEYFGEAIFTGDGFISGVMPGWRTNRVRDEMQHNQFIPVKEMLDLSHEEWNARMEEINYDQAWSMVQFLAHGENGKYQKAFAAYMVDLAHGKSGDAAWNDSFGAGPGFEQKWRDYWLKLPDEPSADLYQQATVARLTSFLARATAQKQAFASFEDFRTAAASGNLKMADADWLPQSLVQQSLDYVDVMNQSGARWSLTGKAPNQQVRCDLIQGRWVGAFQLRNGAVVRADAHFETKPGP